MGCPLVCRRQLPEFPFSFPFVHDLTVGERDRARHSPDQITIVGDRAIQRTSSSR